MIGRRTRLLQATVAGLLVLVAVALAGLAWWRVGHMRTAIADAGQAQLVAEQVLSALLTYDHESVDSDLAEALDGVTGTFAQDYRTLAEEVIVPVSRERQVSTTASVVRSGIVDRGSETVTVLLFLDQSTTSVDEPGTRRDLSRVQVSLRQVEGRWRVEMVEAV